MLSVKKSALILALSILSPVSFAEGVSQVPDRFSGAYAGLGAGVGFNLIKNNGYINTDANGVLDATLSNSGSYSSSFAGQAFVGYGQELQNAIYLGGDLFYQYTSPTTTLNALTTLTVLNTVIVSDTVKNTLTQKNSLGIAAHIGYVIDQIFMPYFLIGGQYTNIKSKYESSNATTGFGLNSVDNFKKWGVLLGAGLSGSVAENWLLGIEFDYVSRGKRTQNLVASASSASPNSTLNATFKPNMASIIARVAYHLNV